MTNEDNESGKTSVTEEQFIGFQRKPANLGEILGEKEFLPFQYKMKTGREPGIRYRRITQDGGSVYVLYQEGDQMNPHYRPARDDEDIAALVLIDITTGILVGRSDKSLIDACDSLVRHLLETYSSAGAFVYIPNPASRREIA